MSTYGYITLGAAKQQLANRLYDPTMQFWSSAELGALITEALQTFNALTNFWRKEFVFDTVANTGFYDLTTLAGSVRPESFTTDQLLSWIEYSLLEPQVSGAGPWAGSAQFSLDDLTSAIQRRRDELLAATGCQLTRATVPAITGRTVLADTVIDIRRVAYFPVSPGTPNVLFADDTWSEESYNFGYTTATQGTPTTYLQSTEPPLSFDVNCPLALPGTYEVLTVNAGSTPIATSLPLPLPNDWCWVLRWGVLADLLSRESNARDPLRAKYCQQRYEMGVAALKDAAAILFARINNVVLQVEGIQGADNYRTGWQAETARQPDTLLSAGLNLVACAPTPNAIYSITAGVVENAPLPVGDGANLDCPRDVLDALLAYAQHAAAFKQGGQEFLSTLPLYARFMSVAEQYNARLGELGEYTSVILGLAQRFESQKPRLKEPEYAAAQQEERNA